MKKILVTGGAGFIGSNFVEHYLEKTETDQIFVLDSLTYAGSLENLKSVASSPRFEFLRGDIVDMDTLAQQFQSHQFTDIIHFAAESHVDNSISAPGAFIQTNIVGTFNLLEAARKHWSGRLNERRFLHVSTDEVYGALGPEGYFNENTPYAPNSPYSASKAASDMLARSYFHTYGLNIVTTNCSNNFGPHQHPEKLIPKVISNAMALKTIPIYGKGTNVRDWIYVVDHCDAVFKAFQVGQAGETYVIGSRNELQNLDLAKEICRQLDSSHPRSDGKLYGDLIEFVTDRAGHDWRYAIDPSKAERDLNWSPDTSFQDGLQKTITWYLDQIQSKENL